MKNYDAIKNELMKFSDAEKAEFLPKFFQAFPGGYGEGDEFLGIVVPHQRQTARKYYQKTPLSEIEKLLNEPIHEYRLTALFMLTLKYEKSKIVTERDAIVDLYMDNLANINNWDLIDSSAHKILGPHFIDKDKSILYEFAHSGKLWKQRVSIITTFHFIRHKQYEDALNIATILLNHKHDLIHKAVGWMLREIGNRDFEVEFDFLIKHYRNMPRTMLRYAIEKFQENVRQKFLKGKF